MGVCSQIFLKSMWRLDYQLLFVSIKFLVKLLQQLAVALVNRYTVMCIFYSFAIALLLFKGQGLEVCIFHCANPTARRLNDNTFSFSISSKHS